MTHNLSFEGTLRLSAARPSTPLVMHPAPMHTTYLELAPVDPTYVPDPDRLARAVTVFETLIPNVLNFSGNDYYCETRPPIIFPTIQLFAGIDSGKALCPHCGSDLAEWWMPELKKKSELWGLSDLQCIVPCCDRRTHLHELVYPYYDLANVYSVGFGRFCLTAIPHVFSKGVSEDSWLAVESIIECKLKTLCVSF